MKIMKSVYSMNDVYPFMNNTVTTTGETVPEDIERQHYQDSTVVREDGKTEVVDFKMIFIGIAVFIGVAVLLNMTE